MVARRLKNINPYNLFLICKYKSLSLPDTQPTEQEMRINVLTCATALALLITSMSACINTAGNGTEKAPLQYEAANPALENILTRTSVRQYDPDRTVSSDTVDLMLRAAMSAPTAVNKQPWAFVVLDSRESLDSLAEVHFITKLVTTAV